ncbi:hypothetical protein [Burkholderia pseudomultivorans]|uniref:Uncharacterized protein n=1 Tax=Burkholderia pseudomultivorans TaxID=1207504 RepID=A0A132EHZ3_9BURK|nr:hypothetical protein [Burkholderia pseudomultivorans]KWF30484.1 hypothetical protein WT56_13725 [Burkholderia pseudomultivorans]
MNGTPRPAIELLAGIAFPVLPTIKTASPFVGSGEQDVDTGGRHRCDGPGDEPGRAYDRNSIGMPGSVPDAVRGVDACTARRRSVRA